MISFQDIGLSSKVKELKRSDCTDRKISSSRAGCIVLQSTRNFIGDTAEKGPFNVAPLLARWPGKERSDVLSLF